MGGRAVIRAEMGAITGEKEFVEGLLDEALEDGRVEVDRVVVRIVNTAKRVLTGQRTGRLYKVSRTGRPHIASAPGEAPAVLTGRLRNSIAGEKARVRGTEVRAEWGTNVEYARRLENGGRNRDGSRFYPRPWVRPTEQQIRTGLSGAGWQIIG